MAKTTKRRQAKREPTIRFKGWDWTELFAVWGADHEKMKWPDSDDVEEPERSQVEWLRERIAATCSPDPHQPRDKKRIALCRRFVRKVARGPLYESPMFVGLASIKDDWTFTKYLSVLLESLWT